MTIVKSVHEIMMIKILILEIEIRKLVSLIEKC